MNWTWDDILHTPYRWPRDPHVAASLVTAPAALISTADAKLHCRIDIAADDALVDKYVKAATWQIENDTNLALLSQTWDLAYDRFPSWMESIRLLKGPLVSVTSIKYYDSSNVLQTMTSSDYALDTFSAPGRIGLIPGATWPTDLRRFQPITIRVVVGWATAAAVPESLMQAARILIAHYYEERQAVSDGVRYLLMMPMGYDALIGGHMRPAFA